MTAANEVAYNRSEDFTLHPFERVGLGKAPFVFKGVEEKVYVAHPGAPAQPAGTCCYCGQGIRYCCHIESADGKRSVVGCDCVNKLGREDNRAAKILSEVDKAKKAIDSRNRKAAAMRKHGREVERIQAARALWADKRESFTAKPHPHEHFAGKGMTYADYIDWVLERGSHSGRLAIAAMIEKS